MSKADEMLKACQRNLGRWTCVKCGAPSSDQPAATNRELRKRGYQFDEWSKNKWGKDMYCEKCKGVHTHYRLLSMDPVLPEHSRCPMGGKRRERALAVLGKRDAFTGASISSVPEIDHKIPWTRTTGDIDINNLSNEQIKQHFQLLTREHNLLKDRMCDKCKTTNIRPPFLGIEFWYAGDCHYYGSCEGCGWYDGAKWREELNKRIK